MSFAEIVVPFDTYTIASETDERICIEKGEVFGCLDIQDNDRYILLADRQFTIKQALALAADLHLIASTLQQPSNTI